METLANQRQEDKSSLLLSSSPTPLLAPLHSPRYGQTKKTVEVGVGAALRMLTEGLGTPRPAGLSAPLGAFCRFVPAQFAVIERSPVCLGLRGVRQRYRDASRCLHWLLPRGLGATQRGGEAMLLRHGAAALAVGPSVEGGVPGAGRDAHGGRKALPPDCPGAVLPPKRTRRFLPLPSLLNVGKR